VFEEVVEAGGHRLDRWVAPSGAAPAAAGAYDAVMAFGGSMHPDEDELHDWLADEEAFLRDVLAEGVSVVGVCLGAQMLARAAGARVEPARAPEVGWHEVELTPAGRADPVLGRLPLRFEAFQWHHYTFGIPAGGDELARSGVCTQAFRLERAWGIQFHAEVTGSMIRAWAQEDPGELPMPADDLLAATDERIAGWNEHGRRLCAAFLQTAAQPAGVRPAT
jgi:GMP synthase-like glutamine amidotransferase